MPTTVVIASLRRSAIRPLRAPMRSVENATYAKKKNKPFPRVPAFNMALIPKMSGRDVNKDALIKYGKRIRIDATSAA
jgi:hypothetical protein